ncbi:MAG: arsenate reductase ArsC [Acidobacteriota bacterium]|nr:arsenate reductase ArsC [Acidobacteriota bacterium]MDH3785048.1 arsenate reductase ArsC [Acidobacteriota bacterium]
MTGQKASRTTLLFLCTGNSCRSQMAEAWTRQLMGETVEPSSAGSAPKGLDPRAIQVMTEAGVDMTGYQSTPYDVQSVSDVDLVVTVCDAARGACPLPPTGVRHLHQSFPDPPGRTAGMEDEAEILRVYRDVRDQIRAWVYTLPRLLENNPRMSSRIR